MANPLVLDLQTSPDGAFGEFKKRYTVRFSKFGFKGTYIGPKFGLFHPKWPVLCFRATDIIFAPDGAYGNWTKATQSDYSNLTFEFPNLDLNLTYLAQNGQSISFGATDFIFATNKA